jgi:hypothetical protein
VNSGLSSEPSDVKTSSVTNQFTEDFFDKAYQPKAYTVGSHEYYADPLQYNEDFAKIKMQEIRPLRDWRRGYAWEDTIFAIDVERHALNEQKFRDLQQSSEY